LRPDLGYSRQLPDCPKADGSYLNDRFWDVAALPCGASKRRLLLRADVRAYAQVTAYNGLSIAGIRKGSLAGQHPSVLVLKFNSA